PLDMHKSRWKSGRSPPADGRIVPETDTTFIHDTSPGMAGVWRIFMQQKTARVVAIAVACVALLMAGTAGAGKGGSSACSTELAGCEASLAAVATEAHVPQTGQETSFAVGDDGDLQKGVPLPVPRFTINGDGTVTDNLTRLIWLRDAGCIGLKTWAAALTSANTLASGTCGLSDGSVAGNWRLPNVKELFSVINYQFTPVAVSNTHGTAPWTAGDPFTGDLGNDTVFWSSTTYPGNFSRAYL